jgi:Zn-dependent protease
LFGDPKLFLVSTIFILLAAVIAVPVHELGHVFAAQRFGDSTARARGFLRPDPRLFIEPYGMLAIILLRTGWGRQVPVNDYRFRAPVPRIVYALAGPAANLLAGALFGLAYRFAVPFGEGFQPDVLVQPPFSLLLYLLYALFFLNLSLFAFNLLPIPGLDGWMILEALLRSRYPRFFFNASVQRRQVWVICAVAYFIGTLASLNLVALVMLPFFTPASTLILGGCAPYPGLVPCPPSGHL